MHWTAAGRGVVHEEVPAENGKTVHMLQIFINLAREKQRAEPFAFSLAPENVPVVQSPGIKVRVPLGSYGNARSPLMPPTEVTLLDISIDEGAELHVPVSAGHSAFVMTIHGAVTVDGQGFDGNELEVPIFPVQGVARSITLQAQQGGAKVVVFSGPPLHQPVHWHGPLALASGEALASALTAYKRGEFGELPSSSGQ
jgi:redox-sensitive bicupin YhaK (pirin superfamily)